MIGEYERAFYGGQYGAMAPLFEHYGVQLWMPEVGGRVDWRAEDHEQMMLALGLSSKREITRTRIRVRTAMAAQTREQGRYLGGRPIRIRLVAPIFRKTEAENPRVEVHGDVKVVRKDLKSQCHLHHWMVAYRSG